MSQILMDLIEELYAHEDVSKREIWKKHPFTLFDPALHFLGYREVNQAILLNDSSFFINNVRNNFFPDKNDEEVKEAIGSAINRGVRTLNTLSKEHAPQHAEFLHIQEVDSNYDPLTELKKAKESLALSSGKHSKWHISPEKKRFYDSNPGRMEKDKELHQNRVRALMSAYSAVRAWGLGHFVLMIDEAPETDHSVYYKGLVSRWVNDRFNFRNPVSAEEGLFRWDNDSGIPVYGTRIFPIMHRSKIRGESGAIKYGSLLMKMFLSERGKFIDDIYDSSGIALVVRDDEDVKNMVRYFRDKIRCSGSLEKFEMVNDSNPPFKATKFVVRAPVRIPEREGEERDDRPEVTIHLPQGKYVRVPLEVQIQPLQKIDHAAYKRKKYQSVLPLWYPRQIYGPLLSELS